VFISKILKNCKPYLNVIKKTRTWQCPECKTKHLRDLNAAINICRVGASTLGIETVRPA